MIPRTIYIDCGTKNTAWLVAEPDPAREQQDLDITLLYINSDVILTGQLIDRAADKIKTRTKKDGSIVVEDKSRIVSDDDLLRVSEEIVAVARRYGVTRSVMETMGHAFLHGSDGAKMKQAESIKELGKIEVTIRLALRQAGVEVVTVPRYKWAARLRIFLPAKVKGAPTMSKKELLPILDTGFGGTWPAKAGEDERDAGGLALWDALPPLPQAARRAAGAASPRKRTPGPAKPRGPRGDLDKAKQRKRRLALAEERRPAHEAALLAARVAAGCTCGAHRGRHRRTCPLHMAKEAA